MKSLKKWWRRHTKKRKAVIPISRKKSSKPRTVTIIKKSGPPPLTDSLSYRRVCFTCQDFSGSMNEKCIDGRTKKDIAITALNWMYKQLDENTFLGVLVFARGWEWPMYGQKKLLGKNSKMNNNYTPKDIGKKTSLGSAIAQAISEISKISSDEKILTIVTDGSDNVNNYDGYFLNTGQLNGKPTMKCPPEGLNNILSLLENMVMNDPAKYKCSLISVGKNNLINKLFFKKFTIKARRLNLHNLDVYCFFLKRFDDVYGYILNSWIEFIIRGGTLNEIVEGKVKKLKEQLQKTIYPDELRIQFIKLSDEIEKNIQFLKNNTKTGEESPYTQINMITSAFINGSEWSNEVKSWAEFVEAYSDCLYRGDEEIVQTYLED